MTRRLCATALVLLLAAIPAAAAERVLELDPTASTVRFTLDATMHTVHGSFALRRGSVSFDAIPGPATGELVVDAISGKTGNDDRDKKMHEEVLTSAKFPDVTLSVTRVEGTAPTGGKGALTLVGTMRLCGKDHPVELPVEVEVNGNAVKVTSRFSVPFVAWGLEDPSVFVLRVGKQVEVEVEASGTLTGPPAPVAVPAPGTGARQ